MLKGSRFPFVISDRKDHLDTLTEKVRIRSENEASLSNLKIIRLDGDLSTKERKGAIAEMEASRLNKNPTLLMSTASMIGEGFDLPSLDTLILATPLSFEGRMIQYVGRLHRLIEGKKDVRVFDYLDSYNAMLLKMYRNRLKAYKKMEYKVNQPLESFIGHGPITQKNLFG